MIVAPLHLPEGLEVVRHPDPLLSIRRLEDAPAPAADVLVHLQLLLQPPQEAADPFIFASLDFDGEAGVEKAGDVSTILHSVARISAVICGVEGDGQGLDLVQHAIEVFDASELRFNLR